VNGRSPVVSDLFLSTAAPTVPPIPQNGFVQLTIATTKYIGAENQMEG